MRRPDVFTLDYSHPLAQGLVFGGFGQRDKYTDSTTDTVPLKGLSHELGLAKTSIFSGNTSEYIRHDVPIDFAPRSMCAWVAPSDLSVRRTIFSTGVVNIGSSGFRVHIQDNVLNLRVYTQDSILPFSDTTICSVNKYFHAAVTWDGTNSTNAISVYRNGSAVGAITYTGQWSADVKLFHVGLLGSGFEPFKGAIADPVFYNRALSPAEIAILADRTDPMLGGLIVEERPVLYFDMGGSTTDNLTASNLVTGSPVLGTPALGQVHALTATGFTTSAPVLGTPALGQVHALTANNLVIGSPVLGTPSLVENADNTDALIAQDLVVGSPVLGAPAIGQIHALVANGLVVGSPVLGMPVLDDGTAQPVLERQTIGTVGGGTVYPVEDDDRAILQVIRTFLEVVDAQLG